MLTALKIATRKSPLALRQANFVRGRLLELYPGIDIALLKVQTQGDRYLDAPFGVARLDGTDLIRGESHGPASEPERLGTALADQLCARGAAEILRSSTDAAG